MTDAPTVWPDTIRRPDGSLPDWLLPPRDPRVFVRQFNETPWLLVRMRQSKREECECGPG